MQIGFRLRTDETVVLAGVYLDDIALEIGPWLSSPNQDFESGFGDWSVEGGVWGIGAPTYEYGPDAWDGNGVAGTELGNHYPPYADARLVSPPFMVPPASQNPRVRYVQWYDTEGTVDFGQLQIRVDGAWVDAEGAKADGSGTNWTPTVASLDQYVGKVVQLGFRFTSDVGVALAGWYLDDVSLLTD